MYFRCSCIEAFLDMFSEKIRNSEYTLWRGGDSGHSDSDYSFLETERKHLLAEHDLLASVCNQMITLEVLDQRL